MIVSTMFLHETSYKAVHKIVSEAYRLLKKGGIMIHVEQPPFEKINDLFDQLMGDWDTHNNNEPFWGPMHDLNLIKISIDSGFKKADIFEEFCPFVIPQDDRSIKEAKAGNWFLFGAWK